MSREAFWTVAATLALMTACDRGPSTPAVDPGDAGERATRAVAVKGVTLPPYEEISLDNGARLVLMEKHDVPLIAFHASVRGGVVAEPADRNGVASLTGALLRQGAGERNAREFSEAVDAVGGRLEIEAAPEAIVVTGEFMAQDQALMIALLADLLQRPHLDEAEFEKLRTRAIQSIAAAKDADPRGLIKPYAHAFVHGDHPYGRAPTGSEESLAALELDDVRAFHGGQIGADRLLLTVVGDFDTKALASRLRAAFGAWRRAGAELAAVPAPERAGGGRVLFVDKPGASQTYFWIGNLGVAHGSPDAPAVDLVNTLFGGRFTSMLNNALRVESGLTYGARSLLERYTQPGSVAIFSFCATDNTVEAIDMALAELDRLHGNGFDEAMLASGRNYILGTYTLNLETGPQLARALGELKFYRQPDEAFNNYAARVAALSDGDAAAVIERIYPKRDDLVFVLLGDGAAIRDRISAYGEITEMSITTPRFTP